MAGGDGVAGSGFGPCVPRSRDGAGFDRCAARPRPVRVALGPRRDAPRARHGPPRARTRGVPPARCAWRGPRAAVARGSRDRERRRGVRPRVVRRPRRHPGRPRTRPDADVARAMIRDRARRDPPRRARLVDRAAGSSCVRSSTTGRAPFVPRCAVRSDAPLRGPRDPRDPGARGRAAARGDRGWRSSTPSRALRPAPPEQSPPGPGLPCVPPVSPYNPAR